VMQSAEVDGTPSIATDIGIGAMSMTSSSILRSPITQTFKPPSTILPCVGGAAGRIVTVELESPRRPHTRGSHTTWVTLSSKSGWGGPKLAAKRLIWTNVVEIGQ
jgi:hypothetical protein